MKLRMVCLISAVFIVTPLLAQQQQGDNELQLTGYYFSTMGSGDFGSSGGVIQAKYGDFLSDHFELGFAPSLTIMTTTTVNYDVYSGQISTGSETKTTFGGGVFCSYSFLSKTSTTVPYLGAEFFKSDFSNSNEKGSAGFNAGVKFYFSPRAAFDVNAGYEFSLDSGSSIGVIPVRFGVSFLF